MFSFIFAWKQANSCLSSSPLLQIATNILFSTPFPRAKEPACTWPVFGVVSRGNVIKGFCHCLTYLQLSCLRSPSRCSSCPCLWTVLYSLRLCFGSIPARVRAALAATTINPEVSIAYHYRLFYFLFTEIWLVKRLSSLQPFGKLGWWKPCHTRHVTSSFCFITSPRTGGGEETVRWLVRGLRSFSSEMDYIPFGSWPTK